MTLWFRRHLRLNLASIALIILLAAFLVSHPKGVSVDVLTIWSNQGTLLALAAIAQFFVVVVRGIDLSVGSVVALSNVAASYVVSGSTGDIAIGFVAVLAMGLVCGLINGIVVIYGRVQPIVATLASGAVYGGIALLLRPVPGGTIDDDVSDLLTYDLFGVPTSLLILIAVVVIFSWPLRRTLMGLTIYAVGSAESSAYMSGTRVRTAKLTAYAAGGLFSALAGLYVSMVTLTGDPSIGPAYTLNSIAAVVLGGVALNGGIGSPLAAVVGAFILRTVSSLMFFTGLPPLAQPFFEGLILAIAIGLGALGVLRHRSREEAFER